MSAESLMKPPHNIFVIINPAAGQPEPVLSILQEEFEEAGLEWQVEVTTELADLTQAMNRAKESEADLVAVYGGDGTISAAAAALQASNLPMAILPGGTGNVMAAEMNIPDDLRQACRLILGGARLRQVDMGLVGGRPFILRVGIGLEAEMVNQADPTLKSRFGSLAYGLAGLAALQKPQVSTFRLEIDDRQIEEQAVTCLVVNSGNLGRIGLELSARILVDDGLLDVILLRKVDLESISAVLASVIGTPAQAHSMLHWQAERVRVVADPARQAEADGEFIGNTPLEFEIMPGKVTLVEGRR